MVETKAQSGAHRLNIGGRQFEPVTWYHHTCLRKLYFLISVVWLSAATGGFDGSMMV